MIIELANQLGAQLQEGRFSGLLTIADDGSAVFKAYIHIDQATATDEMKVEAITRDQCANVSITLHWHQHAGPQIRLSEGLGRRTCLNSLSW